MNLKLYIEDMIKRAEENFTEEELEETVDPLKEELKQIEFSDNDKAIYYDLLKNNEYKDSFVYYLLHLQNCLEDPYFLMSRSSNMLCEQQRYGLIKPDGKLRKVLMLYSLRGNGYAIHHLKGKCDCSEEYQDFNIKTKLELKNRVGALFMMPEKKEEKYISYSAQKYVCNNCGREYDESEIQRYMVRHKELNEEELYYQQEANNPFISKEEITMFEQALNLIDTPRWDADKVEKDLAQSLVGKYIYNDDICLVWCFFPKIQFVTRTFDMQRNSISNRLSNFELYDGVYYSRSIARYEDFYWTSARLLYLEGKCLTANQILDRMIHRYDISDMLRITPRKISKFYVTNGIASKDDKEKGCLVFCPR